jgi:hypothetical protein
MVLRLFGFKVTIETLRQEKIDREILQILNSGPGVASPKIEAIKFYKNKYCKKKLKPLFLSKMAVEEIMERYPTLAYPLTKS